MIGIPVERIVHGSRANWSHHDTLVVHNFLKNDVGFGIWKRNNDFHVTTSTLKRFPLDGLRRLIGAEGLETATNIDGGLILPLLDEKIRGKMNAMWKKLSIEEQRGETVGPLPPRTSSYSGHHDTRVHLNHHTSPPR